jgi:hypothetical protein
MTLEFTVNLVNYGVLTIFGRVNMIIGWLDIDSSMPPKPLKEALM